MSRHDPEATRKQIRKIENEVMRKNAGRPRMKGLKGESRR